MMTRINDENRSFGLVMAAAWLLIGLVRWPLSGAPAWWAVALGLIFGSLAILWPRSLARVRDLWMRFAAVLGAVNSRILLTIVFAVVITPIGLLLRALGRQPIPWRVDADSYWRRRGPEEFTGARMERQF
jgi:uncharacterized membrane protein YkvI